METHSRAAVLAEARAWIGTPYHHQADVKGAGVDCGMLLIRVFADLGLVPDFDPRPYAVDWHLHRDEERYLGFLGQYVRPVETPEPGDIVMFRYGRTFSHGGIVTAWPAIVHASWPARLVLEEDVLASPFGLYPRLFFSYWAEALS
jgi:NlpC/P60 family putative phage cell wall peptidase